MSGVYICGAASILTERVIAKVQTPAASEHVDGTVVGGFSEAGKRHPATMRSAITVTRIAGIPRRRGTFC
jgi:hypothetical protein